MSGIESEIKVQTYSSIIGTLSLSIVPWLSGDGAPSHQLTLEGKEVEDNNKGYNKSSEGPF